MPAKYHIPLDELLVVAQAGAGISDLARKYGCAPSTVGSKIKAILDNPGRFVPEGVIAPGIGGDEAFAQLIGADRFEDVRLKPAKQLFVPYRSIRQDTSLTGCGSALACV